MRRSAAPGGGGEQSAVRGEGDGGGTFPGNWRLASRSAGRVCLPPPWLGKGAGSDGRDRPGWGSGGVRGRRPGPQAGSQGSWTRDLSASSAPDTLHLSSPGPTAPAHCPAQGKGWKWTLLDSFMSALNCPGKHCPPAGASPERAIRRKRRVIIAQLADCRLCSQGLCLRLRA